MVHWETEQAKSQVPLDTVLKNISHAKTGRGIVFYAWRGTGFASITAVTLYMWNLNSRLGQSKHQVVTSKASQKAV